MNTAEITTPIARMCTVCTAGTIHSTFCSTRLNGVTASHEQKLASQSGMRLISSCIGRLTSANGAQELVNHVPNTRATHQALGLIGAVALTQHISAVLAPPGISKFVRSASGPAATGYFNAVYG